MNADLKAKIKKNLALLIAVLCLGGSLLPQYTIRLGTLTFRPAGWRLALSAFMFNGELVRYPWLVRLTEGMFLVGLVAAVVLLIFHRVRMAGGLMALASAAKLLSMLGMANLGPAVKLLGVSDPVINPDAPVFWLLFILSAIGAILALWSQGGEALAQAIFQASAFISVASVVMITLYMLVAGTPALFEIGPINFLFGSSWKPTNATDPSFGILPMMLATISATLGSILIGVPIGLLTAVFLAEIAPKMVAGLVRPAVELLAGIPSVIYGFFGLQLLVPLVQKVFDLPTGATLFSAIIILSIMILPTIISTAETGMRAVPVAYKEASLAIGATHVETIFKVLLPAARSPILSGVILGVGRAIGETMAIIMVAGNVPKFPELFGSVRPLTVGIALEMSYATGLHQTALFAIGLVLFVFIMIVNISFNWISRKGVQMDGQN